MVYFDPMSYSSSTFVNTLINWYLRNKRDLPWRDTKDAYKIWISEIILQQTRVDQGLPYYLKFIKAFPSVHHLASAPEPEVMKLWQGLGYYSRARNLHATAKVVSSELDGVLPDNYVDLIKLKGIGDYTASAIASLAFNQPEAVVDGNVFRVLARIWGISIPINSSEGKREFKELAQVLIDQEQPGLYNQAIMEFGATYCVPQKPNCHDCIFKSQCLAFKNNTVGSLPVKIKSNPVKKRFFNYLVIVSKKGKTMLTQRTGKGIWHKLHEFPLVETSHLIKEEELINSNDYKALTMRLEIGSIALFNENPVVHKLSHQHLFTRFWILGITNEIKELIPVHQIEDYAVPVLIDNFVSEFFNTQ